MGANVQNFRDKDYYRILGISYSATKKEIKAAYRSLARKYHPDVNPGNKICEEKFKEIGEAYEILNDDVKKKHYDIIKGFNVPPKTSSTDSEQAKSQARSAYSEKKPEEKPKASKPKQQEDKPFTDIFSDFLDNLFKKPEENVSSAKKAAPPPSPKASPEKGDDISADISITVAEAHNGTVRKVNILHTSSCSKCKGKKYIAGTPCIICNGQGEVSNHKKISVKIPSNLKEGAKIKISGEGNCGRYGGVNGDLYLVVHIQKHSIFTFDNLNVICEIPITPTEAAIGAEIEIPTIDGFVNMKIPAETQSGQKFRLSGQGIADVKSSQKGDQLITVRIEVPQKLTDKEKQLYLELARIRKFNPRENIIYEQ